LYINFRYKNGNKCAEGRKGIVGMSLGHFMRLQRVNSHY
jgi:hypothetical protein